jgi:NADPH:quinone reductase-like Zn-dependent oxidoreductase
MEVDDMTNASLATAQVIRQFGGPDRFETTELEMPPLPGDGQVRVRVAAASVNPVDLTTRAGVNIPVADARFPMVIGWDVSGEVIARGSAVTTLAVGDRVAAMVFQPIDQNGTYRSIIDLDAESVARVPEGVDLKLAATVPLAGLTATQLIARSGVGAGDTVLINAPLGAVGRFATQIAANLGARVIAVADETKIDEARDLGARVVLGRGFAASDVHGIHPGGADVAIDLVGGAFAHTTFDSVRDGGTYLTSVPPYINDSGVFESSRRIDLAVLTVRVDRVQLAGLLEDVVGGRLTSPIEQEYPLNQAAAAHTRQAEGGLSGKLILVP